MAELQLICEVCREQIGRFNPEDIKLPLRGDMFKAIDDIHGYPRPFAPGTTWEHFYCLRDRNPEPTLRHRPIPDQTRILTDEGYFIVGSDKVPGRDFNPNVQIYSDAELEAEWDLRSSSILESQKADETLKNIIIPLNYGEMPIEERNEHIFKMKDDGLTNVDIAEKVGISAVMVGKVLKKRK